MSDHPSRRALTERCDFAEMFGSHQLFVEPKAFRAWLAQAQLKAIALSKAEAVEAAVTAFGQRQVAPVMVGDVAVIDVCGPITYKSSWWSYYFGGASIMDLQLQFRLALADPAVRTIVFRIDSPGGVVDMMPEFADEIFAARGPKPILAIADTMVASCAYWLASQADLIYATASAQLGAIGVYCEHDDISGMLEKAGIKITLIAHGDHKVDGNPYEPLPDAVRADIQADVDELGDWFDTAVARGRGVKKAAVLETFGQGKVFRGKKAIALGMADKPGTFVQVLGKLTKGRATAAVAPMPAKGEALGKNADGPEDDDETCDQCTPDCPCELEECPPDCSTCGPDCACRASAKAAADDAAAILAALAD